MELVEARIGLEPDEVEVQQNTMMNRALSYRLGFSIPLTHKTEIVDAEGYDRISRQMEDPPPMRRTQSEDNTITGTFSTSHIGSSAPNPPPALMMIRGEEQGRKRSRTQSAGVASTLHSILERNGSNGHLLAETVDENVSMESESDTAMPKRVHFDAQPPTTIPPLPLSSNDHEDEKDEGETEQMQDDEPVAEGHVLSSHTLQFDADL